MRPFQQAEAALSSFLWTGLGALADSGFFYSAMVGQNMKQPANCRNYIQYVSFWNWSGTQQNVSFQFWLRVDPKSTSVSLVVLESEPQAKLGARWIFPCEERLACGAGQLNCRGGCCVISPSSRTRGFGRRLFADPFPSRHSEVSLVFLEESLKSAETHLHHRLVVYQGLGSRSSKCWCRTDTSWLALAAHRGCSCAFTLCHERQGKLMEQSNAELL